MSEEEMKAAKFLKEAFIVDGIVKMKSDKAIVTCTDDGFYCKGGLFELNDSKRGKFYVGMFSKEI